MSKEPEVTQEMVANYFKSMAERAEWIDREVWLLKLDLAVLSVGFASIVISTAMWISSVVCLLIHCFHLWTLISAVTANVVTYVVNRLHRTIRNKIKKMGDIPPLRI